VSILVSISSKVLSFVSGTQIRRKSDPNRQITPYPRKVPALPNAWLIRGKVYVNAKDAIHNALTAVETA